ADFANGGEVVRRRHHGTGRGADDRLGDEGGHVLGAGLKYRALQVSRAGQAAGRVGLVEWATVAVGGGDVREGQQVRGVEPAPHDMAAGRDGRQRGAVVAGPAADDQVFLGLAPLQMVAAGQLDGRLDRLRAAGGEEDVVEVARRQTADLLGQRLGRLV